MKKCQMFRPVHGALNVIRCEEKATHRIADFYPWALRIGKSTSAYACADCAERVGHGLKTNLITKAKAK